jgi:CRISPR/Cas system-associated exonuclease Cas4 (RecB family)
MSNTCGYDYSLLKYLLFDNERTGIHVTDITQCLRKTWYTRKEIPVEFVHEMQIRKLGTAVHSKLENVNEEFQSEFPVSALGLTGTVDVWYNKLGRILDYKTTRWLTPSRLPYGSHATQVNYYAVLLREMGYLVSSAAIQYIDLSGPTKCRKCNKTYQPIDGQLRCPKCFATNGEAHTGAALFEIPLWDHEQTKGEILAKIANLQKAIDDGIAPEREPGFLCDYCPWLEKCNPQR